MRLRLAATPVRQQIRLLAACLLALPCGASSLAADAAGSAGAPAAVPTPAPALLDDAGVTAHLRVIFGQLRARHVALGSSVDPAVIAEPLAALRSTIDLAAHPEGVPALQGRVIEGELLLSGGSQQDGERVLRGVFEQAANPSMSSTAGAMLAEQYRLEARLADLEQLQQIATSRKLDQNLLQLLGGMLEVERLAPLGKPFAGALPTDLEAHPHRLADYSGKVLLIHVWSYQNEHCLAALPALVAAYGHYHEKGLEVLGVDVDQDPGTLGHFTTEHAMPWPECCDGRSWQGDFVREYRITDVPETYLISRTGVLVGKHLSPQQLDGSIANALGVPIASP